MAEIYGKGGDEITVSGFYECSDCGHRERFEKGQRFPQNHHPEKPWTLYQATEELPASRSQA